MALRGTPIRRSGNRSQLFLGGDRGLVIITGLMAGGLVFLAQEFRTTVFGVALWFGGIAVFRRMAAVDPLLRHVYYRHRGFKSYYPARSTPFRITRFFGRRKQYR